MKIPSFFTKTPKHKRFSFTPRFYDEREYELKERQERIRREIESKKAAGESTDDIDPALFSHRERIAGSFRSSARRSIHGGRSSPSTMLVRFILFTFMAIWVIAYLEYGNVAFYGLLLIFPIYFLMRGGSNTQRRR
jgi:Flp pilus assembly protein TadB